MRHEIALVALPAVRLDEIGKEKQFQHQKMMPNLMRITTHKVLPMVM